MRNRPWRLDALGVGELEGRDREERLPGEAGRDRLGRLDEPLGAGVRGEESPERLGLARPERGRGAEELQELLAGADGEAVGGVGDDVRVGVVGQVEANGDPARAGSLRVVVGDRRHARGIRDSGR